MSLSTALSNAHSGLVNAGIRADVASSNIANANTPGYVRRAVVSQEHVIGGRGAGVLSNTVEREQNFALSRARRDSDAVAGQSNLVASTYATLNAQLGTPGEDYGLFSSLEGLESAFADLAATPESEALQNAVVFAAGSAAEAFNLLGQDAQNLRAQADQDIARDVQTVNDALYALRDLNGAIGGLNEVSGNTAALEDERQRLLDTISSIIPVTDIPRANGQIDVMTDNGTFLLAGAVYEVEFTPANTLPNTTRYVEGSGTLSGLSVAGQDITPGGSSALALNSGTLSGHFAIRDEIVPEFLDGLDALAGDLISRFSDDALDPTKTPGDPGLFTNAGAVFDPLNPSGTADRISLNALVDPAQGGNAYRIRDGLGAMAPGEVGDATLVNGLLEAMTTSSAAPSGTKLTGDYTVSSLTAGFSSLIGERALRYDAINTGAVARQNTLADSELQASAVDTDQELQSLLLIEQAYAANARVIQTVSDMIDRLLQI